MLMKIFQSTYDLHSVALDFELVESFPSFKKLVETLVMAQLKQYINVFSIFEEMLELYHMLMLNTSMDLNFTHQLLFSATFSKWGFQDDFSCVYSFGLHILEFIAFCKTSFTQKLSFYIFFQLNFSVILDYLFFYDLWLRAFHLSMKGISLWYFKKFYLCCDD